MIFSRQQQPMERSTNHLDNNPNILDVTSQPDKKNKSKILTMWDKIESRTNLRYWTRMCSTQPLFELAEKREQVTNIIAKVTTKDTGKRTLCDLLYSQILSTKRKILNYYQYLLIGRTMHRLLFKLRPKTQPMTSINQHIDQTGSRAIFAYFRNLIYHFM